ncbi:S41 family peptidase [Bdellovibrio sp. HCB-110]|uniref:S41 family peptidase n=1 Tax=Bdellovibrio sp. HCB-110 TaxID=3391182 RepID=UPI0039B3D23E
MRTKILQTQFALMVVFILCSCQSMKPKKWTSEDLIISDQTSLVFPEKLSPEQAVEDIDFLIFALSKGYGGREYLPGDSFSKVIATLKQISKPSTVAEFHNQIDESLFLIPDNHLMAYYKGNVSKKRRDQFQLDVGRVGANNIGNLEKVWAARIDRLGKKKILYISITSFPESQNEVWKGFINSVSTKIRNTDAVVLDLRGNSGGDDAKGMELAQLLFGHPFEHPIKRQYRSQTPETLALAINKIKIEINNKKYLGDKIPEHVVEELGDSKERYSMALKGQLPTEFIRTDKGIGKRSDPITGYNKPIYILMDRACVSSCEFTIAAFEWHNHVKTVGENTSGTFHFSNVGMAVLPNSKIKIRIPTQYSEYYDHRFIERIGFTPNVKVSPGDDAYEVAKKILSAN